MKFSVLKNKLGSSSNNSTNGASTDAVKELENKYLRDIHGGVNNGELSHHNAWVDIYARFDRAF